METDSLQGLPAANRVYGATKEAIITGEFAPGQLLSAVEIAQRLGVSRTPAREAFVRLEDEGFLQLFPRRGAVVLPVSPTEARDVLDVRHALEVSAVKRLAQLGDRVRRLAPCEEQIAAQADIIGSGRTDEFAAHDERFHWSIVQACGNELATRIYQSLGDRQRRMLAVAALDATGLEARVREHRRLLELAAAGDIDGFTAAHWQHLVSTHHYLRIDPVVRLDLQPAQTGAAAT